MENIAERIELEIRNGAFNHRIHTFAIINKVPRIDIEAFLADAFHLYEPELTRSIELHNMVKSMTVFTAEFEKKIIKPSESALENESVVEDIIKQTLYFPTPNILIGLDSDLEANYRINVVDEIMHSVENTALQGSGFTLSRIIDLHVQISSYEPLRGSSFVETPKKLRRRGAIVNVQNEHDEMCFKWAILSALHQVERNPHRVQNYKQFESELNFEGMNFPISLKSIDKFMELNRDISINVYHYDETSDQVYPLRMSSVIREKHIHLLLLIGESPIDAHGAHITSNKVKAAMVDDEIRAHFCWIKDLSRLVSRQLSAHGHKTFICDRCLNYFQEEEMMKEHALNCSSDSAIKTPKNKWLKFKDHKHKLKAPFVVYADIESFLEPLETHGPNSVFSEQCKTDAYQNHKAYSVGLYFKCAFDDARSYYKTSGLENEKTCIKWFMDELKAITVTVDALLAVKVPIGTLTLAEERIFRDPNTKCSICELTFEGDQKRVRDHCHFTGKYRGPAHAKCNLAYQESHIIPVVMHNLSHYDVHLFIKALSKEITGDISIIPNNAEQYISITKTVTGLGFSSKYKDKIRLRFIDSVRFMPASLSSLAELLPASKKHILYTEFGKCYSPEQLSMLERKGVFPYDYVDSFERLDETALPSKEQFYSQLNEESIDDAEYAFACEVWEKFNIKTLREYSDLYLKTDVLLLADVFENFRETCHEIYKLDPAHYYTAPGLSFDAMLKYTNVEIELMKDVDMLLFIEGGIRGGISQCNRRYAKANNKYMKNTYNPDAKTNFLMYLDANNLYGHAMSQPLPIGDYKWVCIDDLEADIDPDEDGDKDDIKSPLFSYVDEILKSPEDSDFGYILEVDLEYPAHIHSEHNDFPFCPESSKLPQQAFDILGEKAGKYQKLLLTLFDKEKYIIHSRMLALALKHGLILKKVHRILRFKQSAWLKPYIDLNTEQRKKATNDFEKSFYKLLNNAIFGKTMENVRSRVDIKLVNKWGGRAGARLLIARPNFKRVTIFDENLVAIELKQTNVTLDKPIAIGMCVLDISKVTMYSFLYDFLKPKYGEKCTLAYTDTDSFILDIETDDFYNDVRENISMFDTSDYPWPNQYNIERKNKKIPGLFKDELNGNILTEFVGMRAKCYAVRSLASKEDIEELEKAEESGKECNGLRKIDGLIYNERMKKSKGVKKCVVKKKITFDMYAQCIRQNCSVKEKQNTIRSIRHNLYTICQEKVALNPSDDKRYLIKSTGVDTLAWGHYMIDIYNEVEMIENENVSTINN